MGINFQRKTCYVTLEWPPKKAPGGNVYGSLLRICTVQRDQYCYEPADRPYLSP